METPALETTPPPQENTFTVIGYRPAGQFFRDEQTPSDFGLYVCATSEEASLKILEFFEWNEQHRDDSKFEDFEITLLVDGTPCGQHDEAAQEGDRLTVGRAIWDQAFSLLVKYLEIMHAAREEAKKMIGLGAGV